MYFFWIAIAIAFVIVEAMDGGFGLIFIAVGALVNVALIDFDLILVTDLKIQMLVMSIAIAVSCFAVFRTVKQSRKQTDKFQENMDAVVVDAPLVKGKEGRIKWSGTTVLAMLDDSVEEDELAAGSAVVIKEFKGSVAVIIKK